MRRKLLGLALVVFGAGLFGYMLWQTMDHDANARSIYTTGMPGSLLLGMIGIIAFAYGMIMLQRGRGRD
jgi:hypothetical protein